MACGVHKPGTPFKLSGLSQGFEVEGSIIIVGVGS